MADPAQPPDTSDQPNDRDEFAKFHELARKLIAVPKSEIDKARRKKTA
jgi:hypothetical protein